MHCFECIPAKSTHHFKFRIMFFHRHLLGIFTFVFALVRLCLCEATFVYLSFAVRVEFKCRAYQTANILIVQNKRNVCLMQSAKSSSHQNVVWCKSLTRFVSDRSRDENCVCTSLWKKCFGNHPFKSRIRWQQIFSHQVISKTSYSRAVSDSRCISSNSVRKECKCQCLMFISISLAAGNSSMIEYIQATYWIACNSNGDNVVLDLLSLLEMWSLEMDVDEGDGCDDTSVWTGADFLFRFDRIGMRLGVFIGLVWPHIGTGDVGLLHHFAIPPKTLCMIYLQFYGCCNTMWGWQWAIFTCASIQCEVKCMWLNYDCSCIAM